MKSHSELFALDLKLHMSAVLSQQNHSLSPINEFELHFLVLNDIRLANSMSKYLLLKMTTSMEMRFL